MRAHRTVRVSVGALQNNLERTLQTVEDSEELTYWGDVKVTPTYNTQLRFKVESASRDVSDYQQPDDGSPLDHPLFRKFNQADRERDRMVIEFDFMPLESLGLNLSYFQAEADYTDSQLGLQSSVEDSYTVNLNYALGKKFNFYAFITRDDIDADLLSSAGGSNTWRALTSDDIATDGFGISTNLGEKSKFGLDFVKSDARGDISVQSSKEEEPFAPLRTKLTNAKLYFDHEVGEHWGYKIYAEYEKFSASDWATDGLGVDGIGSILTMGQESPKYEVWYFRVLASYRF